MINFIVNILIYTAMIMFINYLNITFPKLMDEGSTNCIHSVMYFSVILHAVYMGLKAAGWLEILKDNLKGKE